jgi:Tat protein secretion system quality control protein TatD with DNase activity
MAILSEEGLFWCILKHTHLTDEQFDGDRDLVLARAREVGVHLIC